ncbi:DUF5362 family protein [Massilia rubra]|uniref:Uncharacterized protein n=1 Tax=Massilia rubra TaxID=2607910 RepID=A0ABX0LUY2_9BURK|nr:DUF5362 family protein [Massilia rubra]NHZ36135.1 hypothetical protein [Massilia rubra]
MSPIDEALEHGAKLDKIIYKVIKITAWLIVGIGVFLCLTILGLIVGIPIIAGGLIFLKLCLPFYEKKMQLSSRLFAEELEIREHNLR